MALVQAKCTSCNGNLEVDNSKEAAICPYCGMAYVVEKAINNFKITNYINTENLSIGKESVEQLVATGEKYLEAGLYQYAYECFERIRENYPSDYRGTWGKVLSKTYNLNPNEYIKNEKITSVEIPVDIYNDYVAACAIAEADIEKNMKKCYGKFYEQLSEIITKQSEQREIERQCLQKKMEERAQKEDDRKQTVAAICLIVFFICVVGVCVIIGSSMFIITKIFLCISVGGIGLGALLGGVLDNE